jgi:hypothetical protein
MQGPQSLLVVCFFRQTGASSLETKVCTPFCLAVFSIGSQVPFLVRKDREREFFRDKGLYTVLSSCFFYRLASAFSRP